MTDSTPSSSDQNAEIKRAARAAADEQRSPLSAYLRPFILFVAAAAVILYLITQMGGDDFPANDSPEAGFARDMITHHAQAVEMALIVRDRLPDDASIQFDQFLWDIISTQQNQIGQMEGWLDIWGLPKGTTASPMEWMGHEVTGLMPGMATTEEVDQLRTLPEDEMVVLFTELMIVHHQAAVEMGEAIIDMSDNDVVERLAQAMVNSQTAEIELLQMWGERYGGTAGSDSVPVAATPQASPVGDN